MSSTGEINHDQSEPNNKLLLYSALITVLLLILSFLFTLGLFRSSLTYELNDKDNTNIPKSVVKMRIYEDEALYSTKWIDKQKKTIQVTIDIAKKIVIDDYSK
jgi:hypothetical protein